MVKPMEWRDAVRIMRQIAAGMDFAHQSNVLHGNLRPQNVLFDREDVVKIADFSLFCSTDRKSGNPYLAPEKRKSRTGDIYSAGVIFYRLLTNRLPTADSSGRFLWVDSHRTISDHLRHLIEKMLKNNPADRIQSFAEVQEVLSRFSSRDQMYAQATAWPHRIEFNHRTMLLIGTFGLLVIIVCLYLFGFIG
jgi:serine/threonine protein kinase